MNTKISYDEWQAAVSEVSLTRTDQVPQGWVRAEDMCAPGQLSAKGLHYRHAARILHDLVIAEKAERKQFMIEVSPGIIRKVFHYRLKK